MMLLCKQGLCRSFYFIRLHSPVRLWDSLQSKQGYTLLQVSEKQLWQCRGRGRNLSKITLIFITCNLFVEEEEMNAVSQAWYLLCSLNVLQRPKPCKCICSQQYRPNTQLCEVLGCSRVQQPPTAQLMTWAHITGLC